MTDRLYPMRVRLLSWYWTGLAGLLFIFLSNSLAAADIKTFSNPIIPPSSADPFVVQHEGYYYHIHRVGPERAPGIAIRKTADLTQLGTTKPQWVWAAPATGPYSREIWAPELHFYKGKWYIYVAADAGRNEDHQMWAIESEGSDPMGPYNQTPYHLETEGWAIDGTLLLDSEKRPYFVWSGWPGKVDGVQNLYIAPMESPTQIVAERTLLSEPDQPWEQRSDHLRGLLEGPQILYHKDKIFIIYSASGSWTQHYCLGMLEYLGGDMCKPESWKKHKEAPVFSGEDKVFGVGHCSFVKSPDGKEDWLIYHTKSKREPGWGDRCVQMQPFSFDSKGLPVFGKPVQPGVPIPEPTGTAPEPVSVRDNFSDTWVATDGLGRSLPAAEEVGLPRKDRTVGMFYFLWMGAHGTEGPFDVSKILEKYPEAIDDENHPSWGPLLKFHHWGESWFGYYLSTDEAVFEKHARMLADMGVDVIIFDASNRATYPDQCQALCRAFTKVRKAGGSTPQIAFLCPFGDPASTVQKLWDEFYSKSLYSELWYHWDGKPLIMADPAFLNFGTSWDRHDKPVLLEEASSLGQSFHAERPWLRVSASLPTWQSTNSALSMKLYRDGPEGPVLTEKRLVQIVDNGWVGITLNEPLDAGEYYLEISSPENKVGWWSSNEGLIPQGIAWQNAQPVSGSRSLLLVYEDDHHRDLADFFTYRKPQPSYFTGPTEPNQWGWLEIYPQHVFCDSGELPEQMTVGVAQNALDGKLSVLSNPKAHGRSFHNGQQPPPEEQDTSGHNYQEQWERALELKPPFVFITGWNEWVMMRFNKQNSPFYGSSEVTFVDQFNAEYSRDIEPAECLHQDNYYYQTIANIRRYKGVRQLPKVVSAPITLDGDFADWASVEPEFRDDIGDPVRRNHLGWGSEGTYRNLTGRHDIISAKVSLDDQKLSFYVRTLEPMGRPSEKHWMLLYLDVDENPANGWLGYDFVIRSAEEEPERFAVLQKYSGEKGSYHWTTKAKISRVINGTQMELSIPLNLLGLDEKSLKRIDFKWADNILETGQPKDFTVNGDVAPNDRYNYRALFK
ncbi:MAG: family 43 glycosylhydrolase [Limisphaerales bacterium]